MIFNFFQKKPIKRCEDCAYFVLDTDFSRDDPAAYKFAGCARNYKNKSHLVSEKLNSYENYSFLPFCFIERSHFLDCGERARFFKAKHDRRN